MKKTDLKSAVQRIAQKIKTIWRKFPRQWTGKSRRLRPAWRAFPILLTFTLLAGAFALYQIIAVQISYGKARQEYADLRQYLPIGTEGPAAAADPADIDDGAEATDPSEQSGSADWFVRLGESAPTDQPLPTAIPIPQLEPGQELSDINPDYAGWIQAGGTVIDYPVVLGEDNLSYLRTTFSGAANTAGSIFMDYRCENGFDSPVVILYGHNMKDGSMFAQLKNYLQEGFRTKNYDIAIIKPDEETVNYRVFAARITDVYDRAFTLPAGEQEALQNYATALNAPESGNILVLSTCTNSRDDNERLLVFAVQTVV